MTTRMSLESATNPQAPPRAHLLTCGSMNQLLVRPSSEGDLSAITHIYSHHVRHSSATFEVEPPDEHEMAKRRPPILALAMPYLLAEKPGVVLRYAYPTPFHPR